MATEHHNLVLSQSRDDLSGDIVIAPEVMEIIIGIAASEVEGVYSMRGSLASNVNEFLGRATHDKGVSLKIDDDGLRVDLYCYVNYGVSVPKVAMEMQQKVKQQVLYMTDLELAEVNIHIAGMIPEPAVSTDEVVDENADEKDE